MNSCFDQVELHLSYELKIEEMLNKKEHESTNYRSTANGVLTDILLYESKILEREL